MDRNRMTILTGILSADSGWHVGAPDAEGAIDMPVLRDRAGRPYAEGSSLLGVLRGVLERHRQFLQVDEAALEKAWLHLFGSAGDDEHGGQAARLEVDFVTPVDDDIAALFRTRVGIDRKTAAAAAEQRALYTSELAPQGKRYRFRLRYVHGAGKVEDALALGLLHLAWSDLQAGWVPLGGKSGVGHGNIKVESCEVREVDFETHPEHFWAWIEGKDIREWSTVAGGLPCAGLTLSAASCKQWAPSRLRIELSLCAQAPAGFLVATGEAAEYGPDKVDARFFAEPPQPGKDALPIVPGSSVRGPLRARAERILRTLDPEQGWRLACDPLLQQGTNACSAKSLVSEHPSPEEVYQHSCLCCRLFGSTEMRSRVRVSDFTLECPPEPGSPDRGADPCPAYCRQLIDRVAIDRLTGGAADNKKFNAEPVTRAKFTGSLLVERLELWQLGLLAHVLKDMVAGDIRLGRHKMQGLGGVDWGIDALEVWAVPGTELAKALKKAGVTQRDHMGRYHMLVAGEEANPWLQPENKRRPEVVFLLEEAAKRLCKEVAQYSAASAAKEVQP